MLYDDLTGLGYGSVKNLNHSYHERGWTDSHGRSTEKFHAYIKTYDDEWNIYYQSSYYKKLVNQKSSSNSKNFWNRNWGYTEDLIHKHVAAISNVNSYITGAGATIQAAAGACAVVPVCDLGPSEILMGAGKATMNLAALSQGLLEVDACDHYGSTNSCIDSSAFLGADMIGIELPSIARGVRRFYRTAEDPIAGAWKKIMGDQ
jgi:hypothetical protein